MKYYKVRYVIRDANGCNIGARQFGFSVQHLSLAMEYVQKQQTSLEKQLPDGQVILAGKPEEVRS